MLVQSAPTHIMTMTMYRDIYITTENLLEARSHRSNLVMCSKVHASSGRITAPSLSFRDGIVLLAMWTSKVCLRTSPLNSRRSWTSLNLLNASLLGAKMVYCPSSDCRAALSSGSLAIWPWNSLRVEFWRQSATVSITPICVIRNG